MANDQDRKAAEDEAIFEMATEQYHADQLQDQIYRVKKAISYGIQHARNQERQRLKRFARFLDEGLRAKTYMFYEEFIDQFLEQESKA